MKNKPREEQSREVAALLRRQRNAKGLTQQQVADEAQICQRMYGRFECCERNFLTAQFKTVIQVLEALDINVNEFLQKHGHSFEGVTI